MSPLFTPKQFSEFDSEKKQLLITEITPTKK